ncbi:hypothetical protein CFHF_14225 [Caulobacter flavus]|uniref:Conjugal transfer protein TrbI n=1 Tax=Caulobacter flavus TaxID=1679497 RepID=A0A2N5CSA5_9CAUL|nr:hypothetical protein [Caulobacter flavus]AYV49075.1 hypothetical protein C1707_24025 [Caulobacter flavus]PLR13338.1 hypothetical protein CFHF_14225 [Caulobacter flavus]
MQPLDLLKTRAAIVGLPVALTLGAIAGVTMQIGPQEPTAQPFAEVHGSQYAEAAPMVWPAGKVPDYVIGQDFLRPPVDETPVVLTSADMAEMGLVEPASYEPDPADADIVSASGATTAALDDQPAVPTEPADAPPRGFASTSGDILDKRLPEEVIAGPPASAPVPTEVALRY